MLQDAIQANFKTAESVFSPISVTVLFEVKIKFPYSYFHSFWRIDEVDLIISPSELHSFKQNDDIVKV